MRRIFTVTLATAALAAIGPDTVSAVLEVVGQAPGAVLAYLQLAIGPNVIHIG